MAPDRDRPNASCKAQMASDDDHCTASATNVDARQYETQQQQPKIATRVRVEQQEVNGVKHEVLHHNGVGAHQNTQEKQTTADRSDMSEINQLRLMNDHLEKKVCLHLPPLKASQLD